MKVVPKPSPFSKFKQKSLIKNSENKSRKSVQIHTPDDYSNPDISNIRIKSPSNKESKVLYDN